MDRKIGIVAMIDILGYSSLIENNDIGENTIKILDLINTLPKIEIEKRAEEFKINSSSFKEIFDSISHLVFSDTILLTLEIKEKVKKEENVFYWVVILLTLSRLFKSFIDNGLPLRGAISYGEYVTIDFCFAGKPIINAYKTGNSLNSAGIILDDFALMKMVESLNADISPKNLLAVSLLKYKTKDKTEKDGYFVSIFLPYSKEERIKLSEPKELIIYLTKSFTAHNKDIAKEGRVKLDNTIYLFEQVFKYSE